MTVFWCRFKSGNVDVSCNALILSCFDHTLWYAGQVDILTIFMPWNSYTHWLWIFLLMYKCQTVTGLTKKEQDSYSLKHTDSKAPVVSLSKKLYPHFLVLVGSRKGIEHDLHKKKMLVSQHNLYIMAERRCSRLKLLHPVGWR